MAVSTVTILAPADGQDIPDGILRPATTVKWTGGTGPTFDIEVQWDTATSFATGNLITVTSNNQTTSPQDVVPTSDLPPVATLWFTRARVRDDADAVWSSYAGPNQIDFQDPRSFPRFIYLLANVGVAFDPIDEPAGGWGTGGTAGADGFANLQRRYLFLNKNLGVGFDPTDETGSAWGVAKGGIAGPDGFTNLLRRYFYLLGNLGVGFRFSDRPGPVGTEAQDWGVAKGGTWVDGDERFFSRFLHLQENVNTALPTPFIFDLVPNFGRPLEAFSINGWGFRPYKAWAEGIAPVLASGTWGGTLATLTDGHLQRQSGEDRPDVVWFDASSNDPVFTIDLGTPRMINEVRVWERIADQFTSALVEWSDAGLGGPWTSIGTILGNTVDAEGWATKETWSSGLDYGTHRYWRLTFVDVDSIGEIEINRRMTVLTGDIEARFDDTVTDWLMAVSSLTYSQIVAQSPDSDQLGGLVRVVNTFPVPDLVSNEEGYTFLDAVEAIDVGLLIKVFDRDAPEQLLAIAGDAIGAQCHDILNDIGSAEFTIPQAAVFFQEANVMTKYNVVRMYLDMVERWWGFVSWTRRKMVDQGGRSQDVTRFVAKHGNSYLTRGILWPKNWPSVTNPDWVYEFVTAGTILIETGTSMQARGTIPRVQFMFTATHDSAGLPWEATFFVTFPAGSTSFWNIVQYVCSLGADIRFDSQFRLFAYKTRGFDLPSRLDYQPMIVGHTVQVLDRAEDFGEPANAALIGYGTGLFLAYEDPVSTLEWERFEVFRSTVAGEATQAQRIAEVIVAQGGNPLPQISVAARGIVGEFTPFVDGDLGDTVRVVSGAPEHGGYDEQYRVRGWIIDAGNVRKPLIIYDLNSMRLEELIQLEIASGVPPGF